MVHALEITHSLLKKDGLLIDLHPCGQPPTVEVHVGGELLLAGHVQETDDFIEYFQADEALAYTIQQGLFYREREGLFEFLLHAPTVMGIVEFIEAEWSDAVLSEKMLGRATALLGEPGDGKEIVVRETVRIGRYRARGQTG